MFYSAVSPYISQNSSIAGFMCTRAYEIAKSTAISIGANIALNILSLSPRDPTTLLHDAVLAGSAIRVKLALIAGADPNHAVLNSPLEGHEEYSQGVGTTPLHHVSSMGRTDILALLLNAGANPNIHNERSLTPLHMARTYLDLRTVSLLLEAGANSNTGVRITPFQEACQNRNCPAIDLYLQHGARFSRHTYMKTVKEGDLEMLKRILKHDSDFDLNAKFRKSSTVLHYVCEKGHTCIYSARHTTPEFITALLEAGADLDLKDKDGNTPFHMACKHQSHDVVECLVNFKAKQSLRRKPVSLLRQRELGQHKSYIDSQNFSYFLNQRNKQGKTPLHLAVQAGNKEVVEYLLENGAQVFPDYQIEVDGVVQKKAETPLDLAFADPNILDLFKKHTGWANEAAASDAFEKRNFPALLFILEQRPLLSTELRQNILADAQRSGMESIRRLLEGI